MYSKLFTLATLTALTQVVTSATPSINEPSLTTVAKRGDQCHIEWTAPTSDFSKTKFELMTGPDNARTSLMTIKEDVDAGAVSSLDYPCPDVSPNSAIYMIQATNAEGLVTWSGRFAIRNANGDEPVPPEHDTQPGETGYMANRPWGDGKLVAA